MFDFAIDAEDQAILDTVDRMMARHLPPEKIRECDAAHQPPLFMRPIMADAGLFALAIPEQYGGLGRDWRTVALVKERLAYRGELGGIFGVTVSFGIASLLAYGSEAQKRSLLPAIAAGHAAFALALTEPGAGSDAGAITTRAQRCDEGWRVNGAKIWISNADWSEYLVTACRTEAGSTGPRGVSMLLIPRDTPGLAITRMSKLGHHAMSTCEIGLQDVIVPADALMGEEGQGFANLMTTLKFGRSLQAAGAVGLGQAAVDIAVAHAQQRVQFGRPIGKFQAIQHRIADMQIRVDQARLMVQHLSWLIATNAECRRQAAQTKLVASEMLWDVSDLGMRVLASAGYDDENPMQRIWRDSRLLVFGEGTNDIQRNIIAKELGL